MSNITKALNIDTERLSEYKISFNEKTGEFTTIVSLGFGLSFNQTVQIAKFDFLNLYIPDNWFLNKRNIYYHAYNPVSEHRIIQPHISKNKGCLVIPNEDIVKKNIDITELILNNFRTMFDYYYQKIQRKWKYSLALSSNGCQQVDERLLYDINEKKKVKRGIVELLGTKYYSFPVDVKDKSYCIFIPCGIPNEYTHWLFAKKLPDNYVNAFSCQYSEESFNDLTKNHIANSLRLIKSLLGKKNGHRLYKFLMQCMLIEGLYIEEVFGSFKIASEKLGTFAILKETDGKNNSGWKLTFINGTTSRTAEVIFRGSNSNTGSLFSEIEFRSHSA